jgi:hypothetical protein
MFTVLLYGISEIIYKKKFEKQKRSILNNYKQLLIDSPQIENSTIEEKLKIEHIDKKTSFGDLHKKTLEILTGNILND